MWIVTRCQWLRRVFVVGCLMTGEKEKHTFFHTQRLMQLWEAALNTLHINTEAMAGFCDCSEKLSKQIIAEAEDSCHTITLSHCSLSTMNPRHMLLFYGVLFYWFHMVISATCNRKTVWQQHENVCGSRVELTLLMDGSSGVSTAACRWLNEEDFQYLSVVNIWQSSFSDFTHRYMCTHADTHTTRTRRKTHSVQRRANQLSNRLSVPIFIIRLRTYGSALIRSLGVFLYVCVSWCQNSST